MEGKIPALQYYYNIAAPYSNIIVCMGVLKYLTADNFEVDAILWCHSNTKNCLKGDLQNINNY